jgi:hypothetical protein
MEAMAISSRLDKVLQTLRTLKPELESRYHVASVAVFGSYVRGVERSGSDLDLLVSFKEPPSLIAFVELENTLTDALGVKVDLVMEDALKPAIGRRIRQELMAV